MSQTSDRVSALAARYAKLQPSSLADLSPARAELIASEIRTMASSLLRQDETRGLRGLFKKVLGA